MVRNREYGSFIDGESKQSDKTFEVRDPSRDERITSVSEASAADVNRAVEAAAQAQSDWAGRSPEERSKILRSVADHLRDNAGELAELETLEVGRPISTSRMVCEAAVTYIDYYAGMPTKIEGSTIPVPGERIDYTVREPLGVTAQIVPWNVPTLLALRGVAPALTCGNAVVIKPSPEAPLALIRLAELAHEAGLPAGVFNVVPGHGEPTGEALITNDQTAHVTFTGSRSTGTHVGTRAVKNITPVTLELGGKSPGIVFDDANIERAVDDALSIYNNSGQICYATTRLFVHERIYNDFITQLADAVASLSVGPGQDDFDVGPLITNEALENVAKFVEDAVEGGRLLAGGEALDRPGNFYEPTLIDQIDDDAPISCNEVFGPVVTMYKFGSESEVIERANDTEYGLYGAIWTENLGRAHRVAHELEAGSIVVNEYPATFPQAPFGGYKKSGIGRQKGLQAVHHFTQLKNVTINTE